VIGHQGYAGVPDALRTLVESAPRFGIEPYLEDGLRSIVGNAKRLDAPDQLDALLTLGGDGTLLRGARLIQSHQVPILGINMGRLGFLTCCPANQLTTALQHLARKEYHTETRMALVATLEGVKGKSANTWIALT